MEMILVYVTCPNHDTAASIAEMLVKQRLVACANISSPVTSHYIWNGIMQKNEEVVMLLKTTQDRYQHIEEAIQTSHPYECPCIISLPATQGYAPFITWVQETTHDVG